MNVIRLCGGLGNQLFQYAFGRAQKANGIEVGYNLMWYGKKANAYRPFQLNKFNVNVPVVPFVKTTIFEKYVNGFDLTLLKKHSFNFMGYWQAPEYFEGVFPELEKEIVVKEEFHTPEFLRLKEEITNCKSLSIHVRRGDYVGHDGWVVLPNSYYHKALQIVQGLRDIDKIYVFSDDMWWCKQNFKNVEFVHLDDHLDFELMKTCKHNIIGNSTFSWWAAKLNNNPDKVVIIPSRWRQAKEAQEQMQKGFLSPDGWIKV